MNDVKVTCPCCKKRLLDVSDEFFGMGALKMKCGKCKSVVEIDVHNESITIRTISLPKASWKIQSSVYTIK